jgi:hypothetical protein
VREKVSCCKYNKIWMVTDIEINLEYVGIEKY